MKELKDHVIVYDDECPMCDLYTRAFVKSQMLGEHGREPYSWLPPAVSRHLSKDKARNEIALVNVKSGETYYGVDSLFMVIGYRFPFLRLLFSFSLFRGLMKSLYSFVSYNRRVIIPARKFEGRNSCTPDFNLTYRVAFIVFAWLITAVILSRYALFMQPLLPAGNVYRELMICGGQIAFQTMAVFFIRRERIVHYLGNMMSVSLGGVLALLPALALAHVVVVSPYLMTGWFMITAGLMLLEHSRRIKILGIHWMASVTWVLFRVLILMFIL